MSQDLKAAKSETNQKWENYTQKHTLIFLSYQLKEKELKKCVGVQFNAKKTRLASEAGVEQPRKKEKKVKKGIAIF